MHPFSDRTSRPPMRHRAVAVAVLAAVTWACASSPALAQTSTAATDAASASRQYQIGQGSLTEVLNQFAQASGAILTFDPALTQGLNSNGLSGDYTVQRGFEALLLPHNLQAVRNSSGSYGMRRVNDYPTPASSAAATGQALQEVVVTGNVKADSTSEGTGSYGVRAAATATKLDLSLRETPQSVTVVTRQQLDDMGAQTLTDVMGQVTGVVVTANDTERVSYMSRGYAINTFQIDGVNTSYNNGYVRLSSDPAVYDRMEVLRGAAGQTLGAGDPGGTVNQVRKRPTAEFAGYASATLGSWNSRRGEIDLGGPLALNGHVRGRMVAVKQKSDSFRDWYTSDKEVFYGVLEADLGDSTIVSLGYDYQRPENSGVTWGTIPYWLSDGSLANMPRSFNPAARWSQWNVQQKQTFLRLEHQFNDDWRAKVTYTDDDQKVYGHRWFGGAGYFPNPDGTGKTAWDGGGNNYGKAKSWDLDVNGRFQLLGREHLVNVGYHRERYRNSSPAGIDHRPDDYTWEVPDWRNWDGIVPEYSREYLGYDSSYKIGRQSAFYVSAKLSLTNRISALVGGRYSDWSEDSYSYLANSGGYSRTGYSIDNVWTPYAAVMVDLTKNLTAYGSYTDIFKPQNRRNFEGKYIDPVNGKHYELGLKGEFFDGALNTSAAIFRSRKDNEAEIDDSGQLPDGAYDPSKPPEGYNGSGYMYIPGTEELAYRSTGKGNKVNGFEFEAQGAITPNWNLSAGWTRAVAKNNAGDTINAYLPKNTFRLRTSYRLPGAWSNLRVGGGVTWQSQTWADVSGVPTGQTDASGKAITEKRRITQAAYYLVNLSANYQVNKQLSVSMNVNNLFDKSYYQRVGFYSGVMYGSPRDWRLNVRYTF
ncbi:TonB-dependent siderophore receptor [Lampropedia puyangensis]|uniref:TonB-dependent siderophore receptor n=1 Tax=Lampropedia puyangensis TaxID=1330072 RepID=A0A4S8FBN1_9BURK|nr:TonB-dependent receptor [Lampropedia puyangensis]THU05078.1 TonB-dependent siderophore receptor [Lampropedia puyangensis]